MKQYKNVVFLLLFIGLHMNILCQTNINNGGLDTMNIDTANSKAYIFSYASTDGILHLTSETTDPAYPGYIYALCSTSTESASETNRMFSSQEYDKNELYINLGHADCSSGNTLNILLKAPGTKASTSITLKANIVSGIELDNTNKKAKFKISHIPSITYKVPSTPGYNKILIYGLGESYKYFTMKVKYGTTPTLIDVKQRFENGYGAIVDLSTFSAGTEITITISPQNSAYEQTKVEVGFEVMDQKESYKRQIKLLEHVYGAVTNALETCYTVPEAVLSKYPVLLINAYSQAVSFIVKKISDNTKLYSQDGFHNSFIRLLEPFNNTNYFCIRNYIPKDGNTPLLSESTYDFQLYYESELSNNQMFIMPLINGKIYTHSLNRGSVMVYRHNYYPTETTKVYSANLLRIRGNPRLYGYVCTDYPNCKVTSQTSGLQAVGAINQYYINKISNAAGNTATDTNGEPVSDLKQQYMSVVICDTQESDPNYGECKYTIEINNEGDEIQLLPERVFTTSLLTGTQYFYVRVSNSEKLKKLNITLTVLTGDAHMKLYSTSERAAGTDNEINDYIHHKIFRREVFEFIKPEGYTGSESFIKQEYFGVITTSEPSFIELKYVTDFHFKGYIMTNPGEVNIEYINQKGSQFPYEILNPYIYLPLNENLNKNKDYMFKIRSKECSMYYNYNYNNFPKTSNVDMTFDRREPYTYLTSFAFMATVDNYNYNENAEDTDCPMLVYSGEISNKDRPLLIVSDVALPSNFENTYFIYPYLSNNFQGLVIGIRFTGGSSPSFQVTGTIDKTTGSVNIIPQQVINSDSFYYFDSTSDINCGDNIQCALKINIESTAGSYGTNPFTVTVSSFNPSVPEIIDKLESSGNIYVPKTKNRITKTSIGQYDDTEFSFTCTTGTPSVEAKLITKDEANNNPDYTNFASITGTSLTYDTTNKILQLTSSQTSACSSGCVLLMKIEVTDGTGNVNIVKFTQKQMDIGLTNGVSTTNNLPPSYKRLYTFSYTSADIATNKILHLSSVPSNFAYPGYIYASFENNVSEDNKLFSSQDIGSNQLYIDLSQYSGKSRLYILIKAPKKENANTVTLKAELIQEVVLSDSNPKARFKLSHNSKVLIDPAAITTKSTILIYGLGEDWNFFEMKASYKTSGGSTRNLKVKQIFHNGYGVIVDLNRIPSGEKIKIDLTHSTDSAKERKVEVGFEMADQESDYMRPVNILEHVYGATSYSENCYNITEDVDLSKNPILLINAFSQAVSFVVKDKTSHDKKYSQDGFHNSFIRLLETFNKDNDYFCIKKFTPKDRLEEELGESSYDFQLYYENDLPDNQMFIMPLINGKIYTHSLNLGSVMVYRHSIFAGYSSSTENKIYSANLLKIRGNPKLYGYVCETYPDCVVTKDTEGLEEIERINQYYVNKRLNAVGNTEIDANGEPVSEIRKQYLSVVICDTKYSDPNYGECKYTIEINNEKEDIQLIPERVFATSVLPGKNYFSVRVSNYQDVSKLNITLTVLTGNAFMNIFSDYDNTQKITDYNHHKIFRREVFEFPSSRIREVYWGVIECTEPSFIELKYVTDFHFKGYIMTNPGEVNIEYINKKGSQFPYEILNPYIYLPLNSNLNKNKDYMFKIRSKECSMFYNYNYNNMPNTVKVDMQFDRSQPYTYLTSFAFMTTVDNYNYNTEDDSTDCAMVIYSGEIDSPERPLLIISDFPLPSDFNNTYYVYPFIKNSDFKGLLVDIRFTDNNIGNPSYKVKLSVSGTNILDEATITKDEMFNIEASNTKINCGNNLQCALKIEIEKTPESDRAYNFTVNVYPPTTSIPEVIDSSESNTAKLYIKPGEVKKTQLSIGKNEETEIKFNFGSGTGNVYAILIPKSQNDGSYNSLTFDENTSNLVAYNGGVLRLTKEDTEICDGGCDLIIQMKVDDTTEEFVEVSITKDPINTAQPGEKEDDDDEKGVKPWLVAVIVIVCVVAVAGALVLVYFFVLKKKAASSITRPIEESENKIKGNNDIISKEQEKVINFNN